MTSIFFIWGFITCLNDILIPHLRMQFDLSYTQAMLIQFCFFGAYFICSIPAGRIVGRIGYKKGMVTGLLITAVGAGLFYPAAATAQYVFFLAALFVLFLFENAFKDLAVIRHDDTTTDPGMAPHDNRSVIRVRFLANCLVK